MEKYYKHIGYFNDAEDIIDLYPSSFFKGDEAGIVTNYMQSGYGKFYSVENNENFPFDNFKFELEHQIAAITPDDKYIVTFSLGDRNKLFKNSPEHGYYIDVWELVETDSSTKLEDLYQKANTLIDELKGVIEKIQRLNANK